MGTYSHLFTKQVTPKAKTALEDLEERGIMDERDVDYLEHLEVPLVDEVAMEGIIRAQVHDAASVYTDAFREMKGWTLGIETKRKYIEEICQDLIEWLADKKAAQGDLDLDMGSFKTWMKTSETFFFRFYFLLHDEIWHTIVKDLKAGDFSKLEVLYDINLKDRQKVTRELDSIQNIDGLIKKVELYIERSNEFFKLILARKTKVKQFPFQVILLGATDLRRTCKKIVNLAI